MRAATGLENEEGGFDHDSIVAWRAREFDDHVFEMGFSDGGGMTRTPLLVAAWLLASPAMAESATTQAEAQAMMWQKIHEYCTTATQIYCSEYSQEQITALTQCIYAKSSAIGIYEEIKSVHFPPQLVIRNMSEGSGYLSVDDIAAIVQLATETKAQSSDEFAEDVFDRCLKIAKIED